jgi:hypothetical protein
MTDSRLVKGAGRLRSHHTSQGNLRKWQRTECLDTTKGRTPSEITWMVSCLCLRYILCRGRTAVVMGVDFFGLTTAPASGPVRAPAYASAPTPANPPGRGVCGANIICGCGAAATQYCGWIIMSFFLTSSAVAEEAEEMPWKVKDHTKKY